MFALYTAPDIELLVVVGVGAPAAWARRPYFRGRLLIELFPVVFVPRRANRHLSLLFRGVVLFFVISQYIRFQDGNIFAQGWYQVMVGHIDVQGSDGYQPLVNRPDIGSFLNYRLFPCWRLVGRVGRV